MPTIPHFAGFKQSRGQTTMVYGRYLFVGWWTTAVPLCSALRPYATMDAIHSEKR
ncbi:MAG: hypothetical protein KJ069_30160 [Anaerolineae bacterium]|nr:hypothetical protein [Anaerolineae bacterium]